MPKTISISPMSCPALSHLTAQTFKWAVAASATVDSAMLLLQESRIPVVLCEGDMGRDTWKRLLDRLPLLEEPPFLIVGSRAADDSLWAEALNLGAYDVLAKPLEPAEVMRTLHLAWLRWNQAHPQPSVPV